MKSYATPDERHYKKLALHEAKVKVAMSMARARGEAANKWLETNRLTPETQGEFNKLMRETDKNFKYE